MSLISCRGWSQFSQVHGLIRKQSVSKRIVSRRRSTTVFAQSVDTMVVNTAESIVQKLDAVRAALAEQKLDALIVPTDDPHMSEYVHPYFARREFVSGFTGSAGTAVITADEALLWTDGRYYLQARMELQEPWKLMEGTTPGVPRIEDWLKKTLGPDQTVGLDPWCSTIAYVDRLKEKGLNLSLIPTGVNPVDAIYTSPGYKGAPRPSPPHSATYVHPIEFAGDSVATKVSKIRSKMTENNADVLLVGSLDQAAWLLNMRASDVKYNPLFHSYVAVMKDNVILYTDQSRLSDPDVTDALKSSGVSVKSYEDIEGDVQEWGAQGQSIWMDKQSCNRKLYETAVEAQGESGGVKRQKSADGTSSGSCPPVITSASPIDLMKAVKTDPELAGMREAHLRDGAALTGAFAWLTRHIQSGGACTEAQFAEKLIELRSQQKGFVQPSFPTIAGSGPNGAIIHYCPNPETAGTITTDKLLLVDSGGQYDCGTTDITRVFYFGDSPPEHIKHTYTLVLKGHISMARAVVPAGTPGFQLDLLARQHLYQNGLNYGHGTGHGVGAALCVHEGPMSVSARFTNMVGLQPKMIVSNEPGFYIDGEYGIRIENLVEIVELEDLAGKKGGVGVDKWIGLKALTLVPISTNLIQVDLLTKSEIRWMNAYHELVLEKVGPLVEGDTKEWLVESCKPLSEDLAGE